MTVESKRAMQAAGTRSHLLAVGRRLFAERGYAGTPTEEIVLQAGVTRGALYHHFRKKQDLFRAVYAQVEEEVLGQVMTVAMAEPEAWDGLLAACSAFVDAGLDPATRRIALDAPSVLGWEAWRGIGAQERFGFVATALHWVMACGQLRDQPVAPLAHVLLGALNEGALFIAGAPDPETARDQVLSSVTQLLAGLRP
jgi:AcrR family transcriptional regulator